MESLLPMNFSKFGDVHALFNCNLMNTQNLNLISAYAFFLDMALNTKAILVIQCTP
ncbi:hypothetical protein OSB04_001056 [Centaurea solstitialis]|uniref:Uncharacterized protein n=1 Tax=Centaurea solstitialis TaxID=347529 RepID=A0AA38U212_9ASTR|nr:hypothetical protein OSB04_001056 [Centaurea solstitialis]